MKNNEQQNEALKQLTNVLTEAGNQTRVDVLAHSILLQAIFFCSFRRTKSNY